LGKKLSFLNFNWGKEIWGPGSKEGWDLIPFLKNRLGLFPKIFLNSKDFHWDLGKEYLGGLNPKGKGVKA